MKKYTFYNNIFGWVVFLIAAITYLLTIEPTTSLWDCGEFIASAYKMQVGHPPGAPLFMIMARFFSLFASDVTKVAMMVNAMSALASAFTIMFLFWTITHLAKKMVSDNNNLSVNNMVAIIGSGLIGSLAYTFSDTFWFSAVEGEVYASSSFFTAAVFWAILKWENEADQKYANRWLILIAYLMGLSIGVHLLNLLAIPAIVLVYYFKRYKVTRNGVILALVVSVVLLGSIMYVIIPGVIWLAARFELVFVNNFNLPFNTGVLFYAALLIAALIYGIKSTITKNQVVLNTILTGIAVIILGYSSFSMIVIRSLANPPMDENNPETVFALLSYLNREQYGDRPLFKGQYFNARPINTKEGKETYTQIDGKYKVTNRKLTYVYDKNFTTFFPRMWSSSNEHVEEYITWGKLKEQDLYEPQRNSNGEIARDRNGNIVYDRTNPRKSPTFRQNLKFFFGYQIGHMYLRYFMWNFVGRQNDIQGNGDVLNGNWISGINFIDSFRLGDQSNLPPEIKHHKARNTYFFLPLLLGLLGLTSQWKKDIKNFWVVAFLFILTGLAIVVYLNQTPLQPRERDYAYAGSFYAFTIWIGLGVLGIIDSLGKKYKGLVSTILIILLCAVLVPGIMASENWDDHDRSDRYTARDIAYDYLNSCAPNAMLFTNGDNDTFPLWYAQEVEGIRTDVRVVNTMLLNMDWYIDQMRRKAYESEPLPLSLTPDKYIMGTRDYITVYEKTDKPADIAQIMEFVASDNPQTKITSRSGQKFEYIPTRYFKIPVDSAEVIKNGTVKEKDADKILSSIDWKFTRNSLGKSELIILDILAHNNWKRPVYYVSIGHEGTLGLEDYLQLEGLAYRLVPIKTTPESAIDAGRIDTDIMYENLMNKFKWGNMNSPDVYLDHFHIRTISIIRMRNRFTRLADELIKEDKNEKALSVLDRIVELTPHEQVPYDHYMIGIADAYYRLNEFEKSNQILDKYIGICNGYLEYYLSLDNKIVRSISNDIGYNLQVLRNIYFTALNYNQDEISERADMLFKEYYSKYSAFTGE
ncbi:MAG: DUF2723 domain-containing protein [Bacteroidales bacterium]|nr:DUF2723 domain-containing protein [Bacteroidales bacterium]